MLIYLCIYLSIYTYIHMPPTCVFPYHFRCFPSRRKGSHGANGRLDGPRSTGASRPSESKQDLLIFFFFVHLEVVVVVVVVGVVVVVEAVVTVDLFVGSLVLAGPNNAGASRSIESKQDVFLL